MASSSGFPAAAPAANETVYDAVASWAMHASPRRLAAWAFGGVLDAVGIALVLPGWWLLAPPLVSIASIGAWGLAAQRVQVLQAANAPRDAVVALKVAKLTAVVVGTVAAIAAFYGAFLMMLDGRWGPSGG
jgi:hypothetical protein